jgi:hypothetical protein
LLSMLSRFGIYMMGSSILYVVSVSVGRRIAAGLGVYFAIHIHVLLCCVIDGFNKQYIDCCFALFWKLSTTKYLL